MNKPVRKAVIPAAGLGTRFLPATKTIPKEMLPIIDTPTIQLIVEEISLSNIDSVILVTSRNKNVIEDHFDYYEALENKLTNKSQILDKLHQTYNLTNLVSIRQGIPKGLGHAIYCTKDLVGDEPFLVLLGDSLIDDKNGLCTKNMLDIYNKYQKSVVALTPLPEKELSKFGVVAGDKIANNIIEINNMIEKPKLGEAPSNLAIAGRYILTPEIFNILENQTPGKGGEIQLTDAMKTLMQKEGFIGYIIDGTRYDAGDCLGYVKANIAYGLKRADIKDSLKLFINKILNK